VAFYELEGVRFKRMFLAYEASLNGFIMRAQKVLFVDGAHLRGPYKGTLLAAIALDLDDHLRDVSYAVVPTENKEEWFWFLTVLAEYLGGLKPVIMSNCYDGLLYLVPTVVRAQNLCYCDKCLKSTLF